MQKMIPLPLILLALASLLVNIASSQSPAPCYREPPTFCPACGAGTVTELGGLKAYVTGPPDSKKAVLMISDIFGDEPPIYRSVADKIAGAGFLVVAPDFFHGDPANPGNPKYDPDTWRKNHTTDKGFEDAKPVIAALREKGIYAVGAAGFCWGGKVAVKLGSTKDIRAAVLLHPTNVTEDEIKAVKVPIAVLGAERDNGLPPAQMKRFDEILSAKPKFDHRVKTYPGVCHGWTVRYYVDDTFAVSRAAEAHEDMINWFEKHVKKLADKIAAAGFYVAAPDFLHGDPYEPNAGRTLQDWIKDHGTDKAFEDARPVIQAIKSKGITAIGATGFCWGAKVVVQLAKREFIQAAVLLHPSFVTVDDIKGIDSEIF